MKILRFSLAPILFALCLACAPPSAEKNEQEAEYLEVRIRRWTALEGGEIFVLRKIDKKWSAMLLGDRQRFSCDYQKTVQPKNGWENFWNQLQSEGLLEIPPGNYDVTGFMDGSGFDGEVFYRGELKRFSFFLPEEQKTKEAKQIQNISDAISREFDTPVFVADYNRGAVGDYLIENCKAWRRK